MSKVTLSQLASGYYSTELLNSNFAKIQAAFDDTLSRSGVSPNTLNADIDANGHYIYNITRTPLNNGDIANKKYVDDTLVKGLVSPANIAKEEIVATEGQTTFTTTTVVFAGYDTLAVYINGVRQMSDAYSINSSSQITFTSPLSLGDRVLVVVNEATTSTVLSSQVANLQVSGVQSLLSILNSQYYDGISIHVINYHVGIEGGGGLFVWDATASKTLHNGGTIIDPTKSFPTDWTNQTQLTTWFTANTTGYGVWKRKYDGAVNVKWFGAKGDGVTNDTKAMQSCIYSGIKSIKLTAGNYIVDPNAFFLDGVSFSGTSIDGAGIGVTTLTTSSLNATRGQVFRLRDCDNVVISNMSINTNATSIEGSIFASAASNCLFFRVEMLNGDLGSMLISGNSGLLPSQLGKVGKNNRVVECIAKNQKRYTPGGTSPIMAGDGAINTTFVDCHVEDCEADCYDSDASYNTIFQNCTAKYNNPVASIYYGFWSEGVADTNGYPVTWENCKSDGYAGGFGVSQYTLAKIVNPVVQHCNAINGSYRAFWLLNEHAVIKGGLVQFCTKNSTTDGLILVEKGAKIDSVVFKDNIATNGFPQVICLYTAADVGNTTTTIENCEFNNASVSVGYGTFSSKLINLSNNYFLNSYVYYFGATSQELNVKSNTFRVTNGFEALSPINGARIKKSNVAGNFFVKEGLVTTVPAIALSLDTFNTYISNNHFENMNSVTDNGVIMEGNNYLSMTVTPTSWINPFLRKGYAEVTITVGGTYYNIPGIVSPHSAILSVTSPQSGDYATAVFASTRNAVGALAATNSTIVSTNDYLTTSTYTLSSTVGDPSLKITHPTSGRVAAISFTY